MQTLPLERQEPSISNSGTGAQPVLRAAGRRGQDPHLWSSGTPDLGREVTAGTPEEAVGCVSGA